MKHCKHCDVMFLRSDDIPIPDNACTRCYEEVEALRVYMKRKKRPNKPLLREKLNSFFTEVFTRLQDTTILLDAVLPADRCVPSRCRGGVNQEAQRQGGYQKVGRVLDDV